MALVKHIILDYVVFLNDLGVILHFKDLELLDTHVLEPRWVTEAVYKIINSEKLALNKGILRLNWLDKILAQQDETGYVYPRDKHRYIIELMKKFELCFAIDGRRALIPDLLEVQESEFSYETQWVSIRAGWVRNSPFSH